MRQWLWRVLAVTVLAACAIPSGGSLLPAGATPSLTPTPSAVPTPTAPVVAGVPEDVPLMPGAYDIQVLRANHLVVYRVRAPLGTVLRFYQSALAQEGWQQPAMSDPVVGYVATLLRFKPPGDKLVLNLRYEVKGGYVVVSISVTRDGE
ncbi:MAG: hypothetical protein GXO56_01650 [Chloroflexi bacterium]|nr:hypothetical protein [Chloroflexota bacterium]